ncbi:MAG: hypothetical protein KM310_00985 [Clostridiales bacterium]|nr:hypothetical protein [Clostridiales bacterium]
MALVEKDQEVVPGLIYRGISYRYDDRVVFLDFEDRTLKPEGRPFSIWFIAPMRFAIRRDDGSVVDLLVERVEGETLDLKVMGVHELKDAQV